MLSKWQIDSVDTVAYRGNSGHRIYANLFNGERVLAANGPRDCPRLHVNAKYEHRRG